MALATYPRTVHTRNRSTHLLCALGWCILRTNYVLYSCTYAQSLDVLAAGVAWRDGQVICTEVLKLEDTLYIMTDVQRWHDAGLPHSRFAVENAALVCNSKRWSLIVDPQDQGNAWVRAWRVLCANFRQALCQCAVCLVAGIEVTRAYKVYGAVVVGGSACYMHQLGFITFVLGKVCGITQMCLTSLEETQRQQSFVGFWRGFGILVSLELSRVCASNVKNW